MKSSLLALTFIVSVSSTAFALPSNPSATVPAPKAVQKPVPKSAPSPSKSDQRSGATQADPLGIASYGAIPSEFTFAGTQKDLLSLLHSFLDGAQVSVEGVKSTSPNGKAMAALFSDKELLDMVNQIHVLRVRSLSFRSQGDEAYDAALEKPTGSKTSTAMSGPTGTMDSPVMPKEETAYDREQKLLASAQKFYEAQFTKQGGKTQLTLQNGHTSIAVYSFSSPRSFALLTRGPSRVIVARADGLPHLGASGRMFSLILAQSD